VIFNWTPNFTDADGFVFIEFPPFFQGCRMEDGGSLETTGCGSPIGWLKKAAHIKFQSHIHLHISSIQKWNLHQVTLVKWLTTLITVV
jgi:hypothetical protein